MLKVLAGLVRSVVRALVVGALAVLVVGGAYVGFSKIAPRSPEPPIAVREGAFAFAALGDAPYSMVEFDLFEIVRRDLAAHDLAVVVHVGDIFSEPCRDEAYRRTRDVFDDLPHPVVYTPGDNEWTDCFDGTPETDPYHRLASIREILFPDPWTSRGGRRVALESQAGDPEHGEFVEHARWTHEDVVFATVHLVGSSNGNRPFEGRTELEAEEPVRRTRAAAAWLRETFTAAEESDAVAVVLAFHAHPFFEDPPDARYRQVFEPFLRTLEEEVAAFEGPVLGIHGDFHRFIVDRPLVDRETGDTLRNFTRVQVPGSPDVGWVHVTVDPGVPDPFRVEARVIPYWPW